MSARYPIDRGPVLPDRQLGPGERIIDGRVYYSAAFLDDDHVEGHELLSADERLVAVTGKSIEAIVSTFPARPARQLIPAGPVPRPDLRVVDPDLAQRDRARNAGRRHR